MNADALRLIAALAPQEGYNLTPLPDVRLLRANRPLSRTPVLYDPGIVIVLQGRKRGYFGDRVYCYDAQHYLAVSVPVPFIMETDASAEAPLLAIYMHLDLPVAAELLLQMEQAGATVTHQPAGMVSTPLDDALQRSVTRLLYALGDPLQAALLGPALVREIYFHVLSGEQGGELRAALTQQGAFGKIAQALRHIHQHYAQELDIAQLARRAGMSHATFHAHFRAVTQTSPMQYVKSIRLHQARLLMVRQQMTAAGASLAVGYESPSQFSREFRRLFGRSPGEEARRLRNGFALPPAQPNARFIASH
ncbi:HTH-type transcriptional activator RhaS [Pantoea sp. Nvir]|uniref:AraC family transcriptional regulator n=1 Tax=Pantoea TaxID=53335 RepID=UPI000CDE10C1|nr:AraC family transcriptional regulator [Pantoea agglomerans]POW56045.1 AraC family transcriptional regulator [Pantoea alvi]UBN56263.1 AraC family transcriptional regulator [Pantoea agglomerans]